MNESTADITFYEEQQATNLTLQQDKKHDMMLDLSLSSQKSAGIFAADQTPTPTRLIKNCDEVGLFEDLQHVNPFEETFRRAVEQKAVCKTAQTRTENAEAHPEEDSLHTPQVFPQLENNTNALFHSCDKRLESPTSTAVTLDVSVVEDLLSDCNTLITRQNSCHNTSNLPQEKKYRQIAEKSANIIENVNNLQLAATSIQLIQPQLITLSFPSNNEVHLQTKPINNAIPIQTVKPFILPKPTTNTTVKQQNILSAATAVTTTSSTVTSPAIVNEPSSASLTPTSQLPIKERLKAILNHSNRKNIEVTTKSSNRQRSIVGKSQHKYDEDCMERRRAAATRYRVKMRNEHKDLRRKNNELQLENEKLRSRILLLEQELCKQQTNVTQCGNNATSSITIPANLQIPPSTIHLVMNIPKLVVAANGQPILQNPITYSVEKK